MRKAFTLIELIVSISLLLLLVLFLFQSYDITLASNESYEKNVKNKMAYSQNKKVILQDILKGKVLEVKNSNENTVLLLKSSSTYYNPFYNYITYMVSKNNNLLRIESYEPFDTQKLDTSYFDKAFIDIIQTDIKQFKVDALKQNNKAYSIVLEKSSGKVELFTALQILEN